jgi:hypothetical protein
MAVVEILSPEWMKLYQAIIREGAAGEDLSGSAFGMYELFKNVPARLQHGRGPDIMFGFRITDGQLEFPDQPWEDATFKLIADFESIAPWADLPAEQTRAVGVMERLAKAGKLRFSGNLAAAPKFFHKLNLHDRLGEITAPYVSAPYWETE